MIRIINKEVLLSAKNSEWGQPYIQAKNPVFLDDQDLVQCDVETFKLVANCDEVLNEETQELELIPNGTFRFVLDDRDKALYKRSTWDSVFGGVPKSAYDMALISAIIFLNNRTVNNQWTGREIQRKSYWATPDVCRLPNGEHPEFGVVGADLEIVTPQILDSLNLG